MTTTTIPTTDYSTWTTEELNTTLSAWVNVIAIDRTIGRTLADRDVRHAIAMRQELMDELHGRAVVEFTRQEDALVRRAYAQTRRDAVNRVADMIRAENMLTGEDLHDIVVFVDEGLEDHTTYIGPARGLVELLEGYVDLLPAESAADLVQSATYMLGW